MKTRNISHLRYCQCGNIKQACQNMCDDCFNETENLTLTERDEIIKKEIAMTVANRPKFLQRKIIECPCCGIINVNKGNSHKCPNQWKLENFDN